MNNKFFERLSRQLSDYSVYKECLALPPYKGIRVNTLKISAQDFAQIAPFPLRPVAWEENGFFIDEEKPGRSLYHDAGLYYVQEPSAMCAAPLLDVRPGERVLDLCSAPGGKGTQLAQKMRGEGIIVLNEKMPDRARILLQNVERLGIRNAVVTCADPAALAERLPAYFNKILVDAPCSGEGMFRKEPEAASQWSEENVVMCADRQRKILASAAKMLAPGGKLVYSTCTFAEEEDEENAAWFAREFPQFTLIKQMKLWPHRDGGEGHFAALFCREDGETIPPRQERAAADKRAVALWGAFHKEFLNDPFAEITENCDFLSFKNVLYAVPRSVFPLAGLRVLAAGLRLGEVVQTQKSARFEPAHALAMALRGELFANTVPLAEDACRRYLRGQELPDSLAKGWCAVTFEGWPLGLAKGAGGSLKNHYPKGLRH